MEFIRSRTFLLSLVWILLAGAMGGTYILTRSIEHRGENGAAVFLATGTVHTINLSSGKVVPSLVHARVGDEIIYTVIDGSRHTIAEERLNRNAPRLESGELMQGESYSLVFKTKGTFYFYDRLDSSITITIIVD